MPNAQNASGGSEYQVIIKAKLDTSEVNRQIRQVQQDANNAAAKQVKTSRSSESSQKGILSTLTQTLGKTLLWGAAMTAVYGTLRKVSEGYQYILDLNKQMTDIQIVTGFDNETIDNLATSYNQLAKEMGVTTLEVAQGTTEWYRQGRTIAETQELMRSTLMLSKLGNMESAQATEYLTAILNGFNMTASESVNVVDKLIAVDNIAATSAGEVAKALQRSSNSAQQAGVDFETLVAYITTVSSVTRKSAESIGESFKTIFARMQNIKLGAWEDDAANLNDVERALKNVNIALRDEEGNFREVDVVLNDVAASWSTMTAIERSAVANAIAGVRQRENFLVLMNNFNDVLKYQRAQYDSAGLAASRYEIYMENLEAAQNKLKASWEAVWKKTIGEDFIKTLLDAGTGIANLIVNIGGLVPVVVAVAAALLLFNAQLISKKYSEFGATITKTIQSFRQLTIGLKAAEGQAVATGVAFNTVLGIIGLVATAAYMVYSAIQEGQAKQQAAIDETIQKIDEYHNKMEQTKNYAKELTSLGDSYDILRQKTKLTADEQERYTDLQNRIKTILPQINAEYDSLGNAILDSNIPLQNYIELLRQQYENEKRLAGNAMLSGFEERLKGYEEAVNKYKDMVSSYDYFASQIATGDKATINRALSSMEHQYGAKSLDEFKRMMEDARITNKISIDSIIQDFYNLNTEQKQTMISMLENYGVFGQDIIKAIKAGMYQEARNWKDEIADKVFPEDLAAQKAADAMVEGFKNAQPMIDDAMKSLKKGMELNMKEMFGEESGMAQIFFSGLVGESANALEEVTYKFKSGMMSVDEYSTSLYELGNVFSGIGQMALDYSDTLGLSEEQLASFQSTIDNALSSITTGLSDLQNIQVMNAEITDAITLKNAEKIKFGTEEYNKYMMHLAKVAAQTGISFADAQGNMLTTADQFYSFLTASESNLGIFTNNTAKKTGETMKKIATGIGNMLKSLATAMRSFKFDISITPKQKSLETFYGQLGDIKIPFSLPSIDLQVGSNIAEGGGGFESFFNAIESFGDTILNLDFNMDSSIYELPESISNINDAMGNWDSIIDDTTGGMENLTDATNKQVEALRNQLQEYKRIIDARKKLLQSIEDEIQYQEKLAEKQDNVATVQSELLELAFDDSEEAMARRAQLEAELALRQQELDELERQHALQEQMDALDTEYENYRINIEAQIAEIETHHDGVSSGFVGGIKSNEQFAKLMDGELVLSESDMDRFMYNLPKMIESSPISQGSLNIENLINVEGNLDENIIPKIQDIASKVIEEINRTMNRRGNMRSASSFSI